MIINYYLTETCKNSFSLLSVIASLQSPLVEALPPEIVWKEIQISKLHHLGITGNLLAWINAFLSERTFCVRVGYSYSRLVEVHSGVPQGSVLGPLLCIAYTADLGYILRSQCMLMISKYTT
jgi:hypothetical protein